MDDSIQQLMFASFFSGIALPGWKTYNGTKLTSQSRIVIIICAIRSDREKKKNKKQNDFWHTSIE